MSDDYFKLFFEKLSARMDADFPIMEFIKYFPTVNTMLDDIHDPFYERCITMDDERVLGYAGHKHDIEDMGYSYFKPAGVGVNLWILVYVQESNKWVFSFVRTVSKYEIGTKHGMLLYEINKTYPSAKVVLAGEVIVNETMTEMTWNITSGTITSHIPKTLYQPGEITQTLSKAILLYYYKDIKQYNMKFLLRDIALKEGIKTFLASFWVKVADDVVNPLITNHTLSSLIEPVFKKAFADANHTFVFGQPGAMPDFIRGNPELQIPIETYADTLCHTKNIRNNLYIFADNKSCSAGLKNPDPGELYCAKETHLAKRRR
jgi:hypothetical protein